MTNFSSFEGFRRHSAGGEVGNQKQSNLAALGSRVHQDFTSLSANLRGTTKRRARASVATDRLYPSDSGIVNVKTEFGAKGDGITDDTTAIQRAINTYVGYNGKKKILFFPRGTYVVSKTLEWKDLNGGWNTYLSFQGQNRDTTVIKLKDNATGFSNPDLPKAVVYTAAMGSNKGNNAHNNFFENLTIDTGKGNEGAIGIDYLGNNRGAIRDVAIRSGDGQGKIGLALNRSWVGPALIEDVQVSGFDTGIRTLGPEYSVTMKDITLRNQKVVGIETRLQVLNIDGLTSQNSVPAIRSSSPLTRDNRGLTVLLNSNLAGGSSANVAIENTVGQIYARNVTTSGYKAAIRNGSTVILGANLSQYVSNSAYNPFGITTTNLPIENAPSFHDNNFSNWANIRDYGAIAGDDRDDSAAIQAALNSGKSTIYFPTGRYDVNKTLSVSGNVKKIVGMESEVTGIGTAFDNSGSPTPVLRFITGTADSVTLDRLNVGGTGNGLVAIEQASSKTLVLRDANLGGIGYRSKSGAGRLFLEDIVVGRLQFDYPQSIWARHLNAEGWGNYPGNESVPKIRNNGAKLWIMGLKTESPSPVIETVNGGKTELLGGLLYPSRVVPTSVPAFINNQSQSTLVYAVSAYSSDSNHTVQVKSVRNGVTKNLLESNVLQRDNYGSTVPLYIS